MIAGTIYTSLISTLEGNPSLSIYIKNVFSGFRFDIDSASMPCIMVEPTADGEIERNMNENQYIFLDLNIYALTYNVAHPEKAIVGDDNYKGVFDINNDIRGCLLSSYSLNNQVADIKIGTTLFDNIQGITKYPVRGLMMPVKILYKQTSGV